MSDDSAEKKEWTKEDLNAAIGMEVAAFLEEHRAEIVRRAMEKMKRVRASLETDEES